MKLSRHLLWIAILVTAATAQQQEPDPTKGEVSLPAMGGWRGSLVHEADVGIWTVRSLQLMPRYGCPEIVGLDDKGRCTVLVSYSGKWTPHETVHDGKWLGALAQVDLDPRYPGPELYTGGEKGNLYQIVPRRTGGFDTRIVAHVRGHELHTFVAGNLDPGSEGAELLAFTRGGAVFELSSSRTNGGKHLLLTPIASLPGRVRDALVLPPRVGGPPRIVGVTRAQGVLEMSLVGDRLDHRWALREPMGFGRIARRESSPGRPETVYVTRDDGVILRLTEDGDRWRREMVYAGPAGPRGIVAGRFHEDPEVESLAVFGYSGKVQLLSRSGGGPWSVETIFVDRDKGHWLTTAELDGRNATREIVGSGYGKRIFLLTRPPGYGLPGVAVAPDK